MFSLLPNTQRPLDPAAGTIIICVDPQVYQCDVVLLVSYSFPYGVQDWNPEASTLSR